MSHLGDRCPRARNPYDAGPAPVVLVIMQQCGQVRKPLSYKLLRPSVTLRDQDDLLAVGAELAEQGRLRGRLPLARQDELAHVACSGYAATTVSPFLTE